MRSYSKFTKIVYVIVMFCFHQWFALVCTSFRKPTGLLKTNSIGTSESMRWDNSTVSLNKLQPRNKFQTKLFGSY